MANNPVAIAVPELPPQPGGLRPFRPEPLQQERTAHGRGSDGAEQYPVQRGAAGDLRARDERQQRPVGAGKYEKRNCANQSRSEI